MLTELQHTLIETHALCYYYNNDIAYNLALVNNHVLVITYTESITYTETL